MVVRAQLVAGPAEHGVTRFAAEIASTEALAGDRLVRVEDGIGAELAAAVRSQAPDADHVHVNVTDRLFGRSAGEAALALEALGAAFPMTTTLHDIPQISDGATGFAHRSAAYARVVAACRGVVVSSEHERLLLGEALAHAGVEPSRVPVEVIPLPIEQPDVRPVPASEPRQIAVLGFLYPGKGHAEALAALADLPPDVGLLALGRPSPGHEDLVDDLHREGERMDRRVTVTGYVPDDELTDRLREVAVPVAPHRHLSASGSIGSWLSAGRRPLVPRSRYVEELEARCPGALMLYPDEPGALESACAAALSDPASTWLGPQVRLGPGRAEVGERYRALLDRWAS